MEGIGLDTTTIRSNNNGDSMDTPRSFGLALHIESIKDVALGFTQQITWYHSTMIGNAGRGQRAWERKGNQMYDR
jgi:hypothetical protein